MDGDSIWRRHPSLLERVAALPEIKDVPTVDLDKETRHDRGFTLLRLLNEFRRPLLVGLVLVVLDALATLAGPVLIKTGIDNGVSAGSQERALRGVGDLPRGRPWRTWWTRSGRRS